MVVRSRAFINMYLVWIAPTRSWREVMRVTISPLALRAITTRPLVRSPTLVSWFLCSIIVLRCSSFPFRLTERLSLLFFLQFNELKLELDKLLVYVCVRLLDAEQALYEIRFCHLQVTITYSFPVALWINAQRLCWPRSRFTFTYHLLFACLRCSVRVTVLTIICMGIRILHDR